MRSTRTRSHNAARTALAAAVVCATLAGGSLALTQSAYADPGAIADNQLVGVGSDTTQDVMNALSGATVNGQSYTGSAVAADGKSLASYDAVEPGTGSTKSTIQTRTGGVHFLRPNGSGKGRLALSDSLAGGKYAASGNAADGTVNLSGQVDFSRSSGAPKVAGTALTYIPLARDAVGFIAKNDALRQLTIEQLKEIYTGNLTTLDGVAIHPYIPQSGSGTRAFFENALGISDATLGANVTPTQENQADGAITQDGAIMPFSAASWTAQLNGVAPDHSKTAHTAGAFMGSLELQAGSGVYASPVTTAADGTISPTTTYYNDPSFGRDVYNVVPSRAIDPTSVFFNKAIYDVFVSDSTRTAAIAAPAAKAVIAKFGFVNEAYEGSTDPMDHAKMGGLEDSGLDASTPGATTVTASSTGVGALHVAWTAPAGATATDYRVLISKTGSTVVSSQDVPAGTTSVDLTGLAAGSYTAMVTAENLNGPGTAGSANATVGAAQTAVTVTGTIAVKVVFGTWAPIHVMVAPVAGRPVPTGQVKLDNGAMAALDAKGQATFWVLTSRYPVGAKTFTVTYAGDSNSVAGSVKVMTTVVKATPSLSVSGPVSFSHTTRARYAITVAAPNAVASGFVRIYNGRTQVGWAWMSNGHATITIAPLARGRHSLWVAFYGNGQLNAVGRWVTVTVS
ncbi:hypothetical protein ABIA32_000025 [Streptacidiphilus sp. MAP12-20]|uniref:Ig-like domain repeat protein n=1 Tax=Streptacidiphilus sp. MAP12-20 TaxID=3156299 RepID=UPI0035170560